MNHDDGRVSTHGVLRMKRVSGLFCWYVDLVLIVEGRGFHFWNIFIVFLKKLRIRNGWRKGGGIVEQLCKEKKDEDGGGREKVTWREFFDSVIDKRAISRLFYLLSSINWDYQAILYLEQESEKVELQFKKILEKDRKTMVKAEENGVRHLMISFS